MTDPFIDALGTAHERAAADCRIVSLVPGITELLFDLGLAEQIVGRTGFCVHPREAVRGVAKVGGTKDVNLDRVRALAPTHLVVNREENRRETVEALGETVDHIIVTHPRTPADNPGLYALLGGIFRRDEAAAALTRDFENGLAALQEAAAGTRREAVLYLIWREPWMTISADTYIAGMLALINWHPVTIARTGGPGASGAPAAVYPEIADMTDAVSRADRVLLSSEPYRFVDKHLAEVGAFAPGTPVQLVDGERLSWYGSRAIAGLDYLGELAGGA